MAKSATVRKPAPEPAPAPNTAELLAKAVEARHSGTAFMATHAEMAGLLNSSAGQLVEFRGDIQEGDKFGYRATELGVSVHANDTGQSPDPNANPAPAPTPDVPAAWKAATVKRSAMVANIPIPAPVRGRGPNSYGFDFLAVGESFFVPASDDRPEPAKGIASTVASAAERMDGRKFIVRSVEDGAPWGDEYKGKPGAAVWREA